MHFYLLPEVFGRPAELPLPIRRKADGQRMACRFVPARWRHRLRCLCGFSGGTCWRRWQTPASRREGFPVACRMMRTQGRSAALFESRRPTKKSSPPKKVCCFFGDPYGTLPRAKNVPPAHFFNALFESRRPTKKSSPPGKVRCFFGDPYGTRTHVTAVKGRCLNHLTNGPDW